MLPLKRRFRDSQIIIITNFVVLSSVGIKRVVCTSSVNQHGKKHNHKTAMSQRGGLNGNQKAGQKKTTSWTVIFPTTDRKEILLDITIVNELEVYSTHSGVKVMISTNQ